MSNPAVVSLDEIREAASRIDVVDAVRRSFIAYSNGKSVVPPVGELLFDGPPGDVHIKYGYILNDDIYLVKIASGFPENGRLGLPASDGLMLVFDRRTGELRTILLDRGYLTNLRTAAAGAVVASVLAPRVVRRIGILGTGVQGRMQLELLRGRVDCTDVLAWSRTEAGALRYRREMNGLGFKIETTTDPDEIASTCNLIVAATPSCKPLILAGSIQKGTHITAVGSDTPEKHEIDPEILRRAEIVVADSLEQSRERGEIHRAERDGGFDRKRVVELGHVLQDATLRRTGDDQITVADLTGVAVQDIVIAKAVSAALTNQAGTSPQGTGKD